MYFSLFSSFVWSLVVFVPDRSGPFINSSGVVGSAFFPSMESAPGFYFYPPSGLYPWPLVSWSDNLSGLGLYDDFLVMFGLLVPRWYGVFSSVIPNVESES